MNNYTVASTFTSHSDGSGAEALVTLRTGAIVRFSFASKMETVSSVVESRNTNSHTLGYGKERGMAESEIKKAKKSFDALVAALGAEWLAANKAMYT